LLSLIGLRAWGLVLLFWPIAHLYAKDEPRVPGELLLGSVAMDTPAVMHQRRRPLCNYLSDNLDHPVRLRLSGDYNSAIDNLATGKLNIAHLTPVGNIRAQ
jgi:ABC-type phosphate/phosphonate transport system substrate-binding protein